MINDTPNASQSREATRDSNRQSGVRNIRMASVEEMMDQGMAPFDEGPDFLDEILNDRPAVRKILEAGVIGHEPACPWRVGRPEDICTCPPVIEFDEGLGGPL